jgi:antitoxin HicB
MQQFTYPVALTPDEPGGGFVVTCRNVPELITQGDTLTEALEEAEGALEAAIEARIEDGMDIPQPTRPQKGEHLASLPIGTAMKAALYQAMREQGVTKAELARRMALDEKEARRMLDPRHTTKVPTLERALHVLGKRVELVVS